MKYLVLVVLCLLANRALSQDHLYPEDSVYSQLPILIEYDLFLTRALKAAHNKNVILKVIIIPSFHPESAIYIEKIKESYSLVHLEAEQHYWPVYESGITASPVEKCNLKIENGFAKDLEELWLYELKKTRHPEKFRQGLDGTTYHFSTPIKRLNQQKSLPRMSGTVWSPNENTRMASLENLVWALAAYCKNDQNLDHAKKAVNKLLQK